MKGAKKSQFVLKILIVEDDFSFALDLQMLLEKLGYKTMGIVDNGENALKLIEREVPDAILMDIALRGHLTGMDVAEQIQSANIPILFITSYHDEESYRRAKTMNMIGFLVKPLNDFTLMTALDSCLKSCLPSDMENNENTALWQESLLLKKGKLYYKVLIADIMHIASDLEYATIYTQQENFTFRESLKTLRGLLDPARFFRTHQSHIINLDFLSRIDTNDGVAILNNDSQIPIGRRKRKQLEELWLGYS